MRVLHLSHTDFAGGAFTASYRLHTALRSAGIVSEQLVRIKNTTDTSVYKYGGTVEDLRVVVSKILSLILAVLDYPHLKILHTLNFIPSNIHAAINALHPDLVHIHWVGDEFLPLSSITQIDAPIVWTFHDQWPLLGIDHYQVVRSKWSIISLLNTWLFAYKRSKLATLTQMHIVCPSSWMEKNVEKSYLQAAPCVLIPNGIASSIYKPINKRVAKEKISLNSDAKLILFGASSVSDPRKGFADFRAAVELLAQTKKLQQPVEIGIFGSQYTGEALIAGIPIIQFGFISDQKKMSQLLSAADVCVFPSKIDNLPSTVLESLSCGTPVVAYNVGGIPDMVLHKKNGYLATAGNIQSLADGIAWIISHNRGEAQLVSQAARKLVVENFSIERIAQRHSKLYKKILNSKFAHSSE